MQDYDRRQFESMRQQLDAYSMKRIDLSKLISNIEALLSLLGSTPENWRSQFREQWGTLEQVYSVAIDRERPVESSENQALIDPVLSRMRRMIDEALNV